MFVPGADRDTVDRNASDDLGFPNRSLFSDPDGLEPRWHRRPILRSGRFPHQFALELRLP